jgi:succinate dehydrogenase/fumarate reductase-like Fe-S protein
MRAYMYAYGYKNRQAAHDLVSGMDIPAGGCDTCDQCTVVCKKSFGVREKIEDIIRITGVPREFVA